MPSIKTRDISSLVKSSANIMGGLENQVTSVKKGTATALKFQHRVEAYLDREIDEVDQNDARMPQACAEYAVDIFNYLRETENETKATYGYMDG
jgi:hypothetical protein